MTRHNILTNQLTPRILGVIKTVWVRIVKGRVLIGLK